MTSRAMPVVRSGSSTSAQRSTTVGNGLPESSLVEADRDGPVEQVEVLPDVVSPEQVVGKVRPFANNSPGSLRRGSCQSAMPLLAEASGRA